MTTACVYLLRVVAGVIALGAGVREWRESQLTKAERQQQALEIVNRNLSMERANGLR